MLDQNDATVCPLPFILTTETGCPLSSMSCSLTHSLLTRAIFPSSCEYGLRFGRSSFLTLTHRGQSPSAPFVYRSIFLLRVAKASESLTPGFIISLILPCSALPLSSFHVDSCCSTSWHELLNILDQICGDQLLCEFLRMIPVCHPMRQGDEGWAPFSTHLRRFHRFSPPRGSIKWSLCAFSCVRKGHLALRAGATGAWPMVKILFTNVSTKWKEKSELSCSSKRTHEVGRTVEVLITKKNRNGEM